jgi:hypothetical protein
VIELLHSFTKKYNYLRLEYALKIEDLDCAYWSPEQIRAVNEFHKESENFFKLRKRDENYDSIIVGLLTDEKSFDALCIDLFNKYEQLTTEGIITSLKVFLEKLKNVLSPPL